MKMKKTLLINKLHHFNTLFVVSVKNKLQCLILFYVHFLYFFSLLTNKLVLCSTLDSLFENYVFFSLCDEKWLTVLWDAVAGAFTWSGKKPFVNIHVIFWGLSDREDGMSMKFLIFQRQAIGQVLSFSFWWSKISLYHVLPPNLGYTWHLFELKKVEHSNQSLGGLHEEKSSSILSYQIHFLHFSSF